MNLVSVQCDVDAVVQASNVKGARCKIAALVDLHCHIEPVRQVAVNLFEIKC